MDRKLEERLHGAFRTSTGTLPAGGKGEEAPPGSGAAGPVTGTARDRHEPFLRFRTRGGAAVLVGRSARENDRLTLRTARGNDLWFHVEGGPGSHVVLRYARGREFLEQDVRDASQLALWFSSFRSRGAGTVVYTRCKNVSKPKGAREGAVVYHHHKSRDEELDRGLMDVLLGTGRRRP
jgi:hypothetical protein